MKGQTPSNNSQLVSDRKLIYEFFEMFSRFEYALKQANFLKKGKSQVRDHRTFRHAPRWNAVPDWDEFSKSIGKLRPSENFIKARDYLIKEPPKTQVVGECGLEWEDTVQGLRETDAKYLLRLVRTVRNNLFHGGKDDYTLGPEDEVYRHRQLLESALAVLVHCQDANPQVRSVFQSHSKRLARGEPSSISPTEGSS
jgi:hypothetical protein